MVGAERLLQDHQRAPVERLGVGVAFASLLSRAGATQLFEAEPKKFYAIAAAVDLQAVAVGVRGKQEAPQARLIDIRAAYRRYAATFQFD
jgi:hypothetical protein